MVFATGGLINANSGTSDEIIKVNSSVEVLEEKSCARDCVDHAIDASGKKSIKLYLTIYKSCYKRFC